MESAERQRFSALWCGRLGCKAAAFPSRAQPLSNRARQKADLATRCWPRTRSLTVAARGAKFAAGDPEKNTDYWLTAVTDHFCLVSGHDYPPYSESPAGVDGQEFRFYHSNDPSGWYETRVVEDMSLQLESTNDPYLVDIRVAKLASPLSGYVKKYPILKFADYEDYVDQEMFVVGMDLFNGDWTVGTAQAVGKNVITHFVDDFLEDAHGFMYDDEYPVPPGECKYSTSVRRESGGPSFISYGGELHLVGIHQGFDFDEDWIYTDSAVYTDAVTQQIQDVISAFCEEYEIDEEFITVVEP